MEPKVSKFALWLALFVQSIESFRWKSTEELCLMTLKSDAKFEEKLTLGSQNDISWILMRAVASLKIGTLMCYFCRKYIMFEPKKRTGVMCHNTMWRGTDWYFERWHEQMSEFWNNTWKSQNSHFNGLFLTKVYNIWAEKVKRIYASLYQRSMETLKEIIVVLSKVYVWRKNL